MRTGGIYCYAAIGRSGVAEQCDRPEKPSWLRRYRSWLGDLRPVASISAIGEMPKPRYRRSSRLSPVGRYVTPADSSIAA